MAELTALELLYTKHIIAGSGYLNISWRRPHTGSTAAGQEISPLFERLILHFTELNSTTFTPPADMHYTTNGTAVPSPLNHAP